MRVLVTGASGFVGRHVAAALLTRGHEVVATARDDLDRKRRHGAGSITWLPVDIEAGAAGLFQQAGRPDALIHTAWDKLDDYRNPVHFERMAASHYRFLEALVTGGLKQCLVLGTCLEYGLREGELSEELEAKPVLAYPIGKNLLRQMLQRLQMSNTFSLQWVRLFYLFGPGQRNNSVLAQLDNALASGRASFDMSQGDQVRDYLHVSQAAEIVCSILERQNFDGVVNCCSGKPLTVRALVERHLNERGGKIELNLGRHPYPDYEPRKFWGSRAKLDRLLGAMA